MPEYIEREAVRNALYEADAITMKGVAILNQFPAADVAPVVHGRWEVYMDGKYLMCSACKASFWDENEDGGTNYCPNCGARMDGE